jgi:hypothetical protein
MEVPPPTGKLALVFTDIKNSTAIWETQPVAMRQAIKLHNATMRKLIRESGGYEVKTEGDAFMVSFQDALSAVEWCLTVQLELRKLEWPQEILETRENGEIWWTNGEFSTQPQCPDSRLDSDESQTLLFRGLWIRMGVHYGSPLCEVDPVTGWWFNWCFPTKFMTYAQFLCLIGRMDYYGPMVNRSARVSSISQGGQILISSDVMKEIQQIIGYNNISLRRSKTISSGSMSSSGQPKPIANTVKDEEDMMALATKALDDPVSQKLQEIGLHAWLVGETKLKGLETPEVIFMVYPRELQQRQRYLALMASGQLGLKVSWT